LSRAKRTISAATSSGSGGALPGAPTHHYAAFLTFGLVTC
jgi:hypothetical protein